jgi:hypothetical protein
MFLLHILEMQYAVLNFLCTSLVPELGADVSAGSSCYGHLMLIAVAAVRAFPYELAAVVFHNFDFTIVAADFAVVALRIEFSVHNVVINVLHNSEDGRNVILHVRHFYVADSAAWGQSLEVRFELQLMECINRFGDMHMIAVGNVVLVGYMRDNSKTLLEALSKLVGGGFHRCAVNGIADVFSCAPFLALVVEALHNLHSKFTAFRRGVGLAQHAVAHFAQAGIAEGNRAVVIKEELVDRFTLLETGQGHHTARESVLHRKPFRGDVHDGSGELCGRVPDVHQESSRTCPYPPERSRLHRRG